MDNKMKFACPKCGREEIVIGDPEPDCRFCRVPMLKPSEYTGLMMSPKFAMDRFEKVVGMHGWDKAMKGNFKKEREAYIAAVWAFGMQCTTGFPEYWVEIVTREQTPDCKVIFLDATDGYNERNIMNVEIVEWDEHRESMLELIEEKCAKAYPPNFFLVVFVRNDKETLVEDILQRVRKLKVPFFEIWILGRLGPLTGAYRMLLVHPEPTQQVDFDALESYRRNVGQVDFLYPEGRSKSTERTDRGHVYLPIPS